MFFFHAMAKCCKNCTLMVKIVLSVLLLTSRSRAWRRSKPCSPTADHICTLIAGLIHGARPRARCVRGEADRFPAGACCEWFGQDRSFRISKHTAPLQQSPCRPHALGGQSWSRMRSLQRLSQLHGRKSPCGRASRSSHMLHMHRMSRGGGHHREGTRCCSRTGAAPTAPSAL